jgi:hypothetical protein
MRDVKDQGEVVRLTISIRRGAVFRLDELCSSVERRTKFNTPRGRLITAAVNLIYEVRDEIDYAGIHDEATLQHEFAAAVARKFGRLPEELGEE